QLQTVAEGVETEAQQGLLRTLGCDICQGHVVAMPMEAQALQSWWAGYPGRVVPGVPGVREVPGRPQ
ncbi:UNVERIFIED_CONTAM: EAL domain-containing protein, partial [Salmonella enterica subsp. enterica serovar Weltevreden]